MSKHRPVLQYASAIAVRDGGWTCHYCGVITIPHEDLPNHSDTQFVYKDEGGNVLSVERGYSQGLFKRLAYVDHVVPRSKGGSDDLSNLVIACSHCNSRKRAMSHDDYMRKVGRLA